MVLMNLNKYIEFVGARKNNFFTFELILFIKNKTIRTSGSECTISGPMMPKISHRNWMLSMLIAS